MTNTKDLLRIPVTWRPRPVLRCVPEYLMLSGPRGSPGEEIEKNVLVLTSLGDKASVNVETLVPWLRVVEIQPKKFGLVVRLMVGGDKMPPTFDGPLLKITAGGRHTLVLKGRRDT